MAFSFRPAKREAVGKTLDAATWGSGTGSVIRSVDSAWRHGGEEAAQKMAESYC